MKIELPLVSVIIPVYNAANYLPECLKCLRLQKLTNFEVIFIDDGSTDDSRIQLEKAAEDDHRLRIIKQEHQNAGAARNRGLLEARGKFLSFLDVDDHYDPSLLMLASERLISAGADIAVYHFKELHTDGTESLREGFSKDWAVSGEEVFCPEKYPERTPLFGGPSAWNKMYKSSMIRDTNLFFDEIDAYNDITFVMRANLAAKKIVCLNQTLYTYWLNRPASISDGRGNDYWLVTEALNSLTSHTAGIPDSVIAVAQAHYLIKTLLYDIGDYRSNPAEEYYCYCQKCLQEISLEKEKVDTFYPQLYTMVRVFRKLDYRVVRMLDDLGVMKYIRRCIHKHRERKT